MLALGLGGAVGVVGGGWLGQTLYNRRKWSMSAFIGACHVYQHPKLVGPALQLQLPWRHRTESPMPIAVQAAALLPACCPCIS